MKIKILEERDTRSLFKFESENRVWFEKFVPPRPAKYFDIITFSEIIQNLLKEQQNGDCFLYLIFEENKIVGRVNISEINGSCGEIGFRVAENHAGKGLTTEAVKMLINKAFKTHRLDQFVAKTTSENIASQSVIKNCGFAFTHEVKSAGIMNNKSFDFYCYKLVI